MFNSFLYVYQAGDHEPMVDLVDLVEISNAGWGDFTKQTEELTQQISG